MSSDDQFSREIQLPGHLLNISKPFAEEMVNSALSIYDQADLPEVRQLRKMVASHVKIAGYRPGKTAKARPELIRVALRDQWNQHPDLRSAVLAAWAHTRPDLTSVCESWVIEYIPPLGTDLNDNDKDTATKLRLEWENFRDNFTAHYPELEISEALEVALALEFQKYTQTSMDRQTKLVVESTEQTVTNDLAYTWRSLLDQLWALPAQSDIWESIPKFIAEAQEIISKKQAVRMADRQQQELINRLDLLIEENRPIIQQVADYLERIDGTAWQALYCPMEQIESAIAELAEMRQDWQNFQALEQTRPVTRTERQEHEAELQRLEAQFLTRFQRLIGWLVDSEEPEQPEPKLEEPVEELTETHIESEDHEAEKLDFNSPWIEEEYIPSTKAEQTEELDLKIETTEQPPTSPVSRQPAEDVGTDEIIESDQPELKEGVGQEIDLHYESNLEPESTYILSTNIRHVVEPETQPESGGGRGQFFNRLHPGQLASAYWLSWGLEQLPDSPTTDFPAGMPSWLLAALRGAGWHIALWPETPAGMLDEICELVHPEKRLWESEDCPFNWVALAAGIYLNLLDPADRWESWLDAHIPKNAIHLTELVQIVRHYNHMGVYLDPIKVHLLVDAEAAEKRLKRLADQADEWLKQAPTRGSRLFRAAQVWQELTRSPQGEIFQLVQIVASDHRAEVGVVAEELDRWQNRSWVDRKIQKIDQELSGRKSRPIVGGPRDQIIGWVLDISATMVEWCALVKESHAQSDGEDWIQDHVQEFCERSSHALIGARAELQALLEKSNDTQETTCLELADWLLSGLAQVVNLTRPADFSEWEKPPYLAQAQGIKAQPTLIDNLAYALLAYPMVELQSDGLPDPGFIPQLVNTLQTQSPLGHEAALESWITAHDYRFVSSLLVSLSNRTLWEQRVREALSNDLRRLEQHVVEDTVISTEQALLDGLIAEGEHTDYRSTVESVRKQIRNSEGEQLGGISIRLLEYRLQEIRNGLAFIRQERLENNRRHWEQLKPQLNKFPNIEAELLLNIEKVVVESLAAQDLRLSGEYLAHLNDVVSGARPLVPNLFTTRPVAESDIALEFQKDLPVLVDILEESRSHWSLERIQDAIRDDKPIPGLPRPRLPKSRRDDATKALDAWRRIKRSGQSTPRTNIDDVAVLMSYLGFNLTENRPIAPKNIPGGLPNFQHWRVAASANGFAPVAQFGSQRNGHYDVIGVWERPGVEIIHSQVGLLMRQTGNKPTILLYFGRLLPAQREDLMSVAHRGNLPMLVVDEALLLFLARIYDTRLKPMFYCTLPYAALNPYFPSAAGLVPPEVFKGRQDLVQKLIDPFGPAIVYGGRQLGKSALLRQVQREFHHPENNQYVIYEEIKPVGDPASGKNYQADLRDRLVLALINSKLLDKQRSGVELDRMLNHLQQQIIDNDLRVLLLLDEADHFLDADAEKNFFLVQKLKNLMDQTGRRFKIVLTGLHNVQRFQRISNQPLAHLGTPIEIGPLDPESAHELLVQPLHALGYRFGEDPHLQDTSLVLHILSYTNYHPGLIQLFGQSLVDHLQKKYQQNLQIPFHVTRADVEAVYRQKDVRDAICTRFNWTLALDPRYEAITLALILTQWEDQNGFDRLFTPKEIYMQVAGWWPEAFGLEITDDQFSGFLEEMRGLGVLSVSQEGRYRLRSPNVVALMGTYEQILERMDTLIQSNPPGEQALESYHARLEERSYSPLSFMQEQVLNLPRSGVAMIFGSPAVGLRQINEALHRLVPEGTGAWREIRVAARSGEAIQQQLGKFTRENSEASFLVAYRELDGDTDELIDQVIASIRYCQQMRARALRIFFVLDPQVAWQWFQLPPADRQKIEDRLDAIVALKRWDRTGIRQRFEMDPWNGNEVIVTDRLLEKAYNITGGWPMLLDEFFHRQDGSDPQSALDEFRRELAQPDSELQRLLLKNLNLYDECPRQVLSTLLQEEVHSMIVEGQPHGEVLSLALEEIPVIDLNNTVEYLSRMALLDTESYPAVEPVLAQLWHED